MVGNIHSRFAYCSTAYAAWREKYAGLHGCAHYYPDDYYAFALANDSWLNDYALYMALKTANGMKSWTEWPREYRLRDAIFCASSYGILVPRTSSLCVLTA